MDQFKKTKIFQDNLDEFNEAEEVVSGLVDEYAAAERQDYIEWGEDDDKGDESDNRMSH